MEKKSVKKPPSTLVKGYLFAYNSIETIGWSVLLWQLIAYYLYSQNENVSLYDSIKWSMIVFQNAAVLEILHAVTGVMVVCGVVIPTVAAKNTIGLPLALFAWCVTEIIRYGYYALNLVNAVPHILVWLRYTTFIILYPIGVTGELLCFYAAQQEVEETRLWTIEMPNNFNFIFSYRMILLSIMFIYIPVFPQLYMHMFTLRRKILGGGNKTDSKKGS